MATGWNYDNIWAGRNKHTSWIGSAQGALSGTVEPLSAPPERQMTGGSRGRGLNTVTPSDSPAHCRPQTAGKSGSPTLSSTSTRHNRRCVSPRSVCGWEDGRSASAPPQRSAPETGRPGDWHPSRAAGDCTKAQDGSPETAQRHKTVTPETER